MENKKTKTANTELRKATLELAGRLKKLRLSRGWSQVQLADKIAVSKQRVSKYERGIMAPPIDMLVRIASAYEVSLDYLLRDEKDPGVSIGNRELLMRIEEIGKLSERDQRLLTVILDTFIKKRRLEELVKAGETEEGKLYEI